MDLQSQYVESSFLSNYMEQLVVFVCRQARLQPL